MFRDQGLGVKGLHPNTQQAYTLTLNSAPRRTLKSFLPIISATGIRKLRARFVPAYTWDCPGDIACHARATGGAIIKGKHQGESELAAVSSDGEAASGHDHWHSCAATSERDPHGVGCAL